MNESQRQLRGLSSETRHRQDQRPPHLPRYTMMQLPIWGSPEDQAPTLEFQLQLDLMLLPATGK